MNNATGRAEKKDEAVFVVKYQKMVWSVCAFWEEYPRINR